LYDEQMNDEEQQFVQNLALFLVNFFSEHVKVISVK